MVHRGSVGADCALDTSGLAGHDDPYVAAVVVDAAELENSSSVGADALTVDGGVGFAAAVAEGDDEIEDESVLEGLGEGADGYAAVAAYGHLEMSPSGGSRYRTSWPATRPDSAVAIVVGTF